MAIPTSLFLPTTMQSLLAATTSVRTRTFATCARRFISTTPTAPQFARTSAPLPWFVDPSDSRYTPQKRVPRARNLLPLAPIPAAIPQDSHIARLHAALATSPLLEPGTLVVTEPPQTAVGPPLPLVATKGRRKRGRTYSGEGIPDPGSGIWSWVVIAQVHTYKLSCADPSTDALARPG